jgi:lysophospholipase L1-like esterase
MKGRDKTHLGTPTVTPMAVILCFGDSLTYGFDPATGARFGPADRWPDVMASELGPEHTVITEALPGRTTVFDSPYAPARSGKELLAPILESHAPVDLVILMLGTNDLQSPLELSARHSASGLWTLIDIVFRSGAAPGAGKPACLVVAPPPISDAKGFMGVFFAGRDQESQQLPVHFQTIAEAAGAGFFSAGEVVQVSAVDGVHLDAASQQTLGRALAEQVRRHL